MEIVAGESGIRPLFFSGEDRWRALGNVPSHILVLLLYVLVSDRFGWVSSVLEE